MNRVEPLPQLVHFRHRFLLCLNQVGPLHQEFLHKRVGHPPRQMRDQSGADHRLRLLRATFCRERPLLPVLAAGA